MKLQWTRQALDDLIQIQAYYQQFSGSAAQGVIDRVVSRCEDLIEFPNQGSMQPDLKREDVRTIVVDHYRITYQILEDAIQVQTIFDWRQDPAKER